MAEATHKERYIETVGRRKMASARVRISKASKTSIVVNDRPFADYFPTPALQNTVEKVFALSPDAHFLVTARIIGGGMQAQAEALRLGIARALVENEAGARKDLKKAGFLKRDPRTKERKKFGLKKARRAPQWSKR